MMKYPLATNDLLGFLFLSYRFQTGVEQSERDHPSIDEAEFRQSLTIEEWY